MTSIRKAVISDIPGVVDVHLASFQNFFLTFLGRAFLVHLYFEVAREPNAVFLVATSAQNVVLGFAAGVPNLSAFYARIARQNWLKFGWASIGAAVRRPSIIPRLFRSLRASESASQAACPATLMSIAVAPGAKRTGLGKGLISRFLGDMEAGGIQAVCLTTDRDKNDPTIAFYERLGFTRVREFRTKEGRWICEYFIHPHEYSIEPKAHSRIPMTAPGETVNQARI